MLALPCHHKEPRIDLKFFRIATLGYDITGGTIKFPYKVYGIYIVFHGDDSHGNREFYFNKYLRGITIKPYCICIEDKNSTWYINIYYDKNQDFGFKMILPESEKMLLPDCFSIKDVTINNFESRFIDFFEFVKYIYKKQQIKDWVVKGDYYKLKYSDITSFYYYIYKWLEYSKFEPEDYRKCAYYSIKEMDNLILNKLLKGKEEGIMRKKHIGLYINHYAYGLSCIDDEFTIEDIRFSYETTVIIWKSGDKTVVNLDKEDNLDLEKAIMAAYTKKILDYKSGTCKENSINRIVNKYTDKYNEYYENLSKEDLDKHREKMKERAEKKKKERKE